MPQLFGNQAPQVQGITKSPWANNSRKTHCKRGHEFTEENTLVDSNGSRQCRACNRFRKTRAWRAARERSSVIDLVGPSG